MRGATPGFSMDWHLIAWGRIGKPGVALDSTSRNEQHWEASNSGLWLLLCGMDAATSIEPGEPGRTTTIRCSLVVGSLRPGSSSAKSEPREAEPGRLRLVSRSLGQSCLCRRVNMARRKRNRRRRVRAEDLFRGFSEGSWFGALSAVERGGGGW